MSSFFESGSKVASVSSIKSVKDFLPKDKAADSLAPKDYTQAGFDCFASFLPGMTDKDSDKFVVTLRTYCETKKKIGKDGIEYADLGYMGKGRTKQAIGAIYGDGKLGNVLYSLALGFDTQARRDDLRSIWLSGKVKAQK